MTCFCLCDVVLEYDLKSMELTDITYVCTKTSVDTYVILRRRKAGLRFTTWAKSRNSTRSSITSNTPVVCIEKLKRTCQNNCLVPHTLYFGPPFIWCANTCTRQLSCACTSTIYTCAVYTACGALRSRACPSAGATGSRTADGFLNSIKCSSNSVHDAMRRQPRDHTDARFRTCPVGRSSCFVRKGMHRIPLICCTRNEKIQSVDG